MVREQLLDAAGRIVAAEGTAGLTTRRLARDAGTSTMAVYTHFGGMLEVQRALRERGYARLLEALAAADGGDPLQRVADMCLAYVAFGAAEGELYRVMFTEQPLDEQDAAACAATFEPLVAAVAACGFAGDPVALGTELWAAGHGVVTLRLAGLLPAEQAPGVAAATLSHLLIAFGADGAEVQRRVSPSGSTPSRPT